jgi:hypothetical protein
MGCVELGHLIALLVGNLQIKAHICALPRAPYQERQRFDGPKLSSQMPLFSRHPERCRPRQARQ